MTDSVIARITITGGSSGSLQFPQINETKTFSPRQPMNGPIIKRFSPVCPGVQSFCVIAHAAGLTSQECASYEARPVFQPPFLLTPQNAMVAAGENVQFHIGSVGACLTADVKAIANWDDGSPPLQIDNIGPTQLQLVHAYSQAGQYRISVKINAEFYSG